MSKPYHRQYKVCLIGDGFVGKTSLRRRFLGKVFKTDYIATIGVDFAQKSVVLDGTTVLLVIWDIAGQPLYQGLRKRYYDGCSGIVLVYSVIDRPSFDNASKWLVEAHGFMRVLPPVIIIGNKSDLRSTRPVDQTVTAEEGQAFAAKFSERLNTPTIFIETSALTGENVDEAFARLTRSMIEASVRRQSGIASAQIARPVEPGVRVSVATVVSPTPSQASSPHAAADLIQSSPNVSEAASSPATSTAAGEPAVRVPQVTEKGLVSEAEKAPEPTSPEATAGTSLMGPAAESRETPSTSAPAHSTEEPSTSDSVVTVAPQKPLVTGVPEADRVLSSPIDASHLHDDEVMHIVAELGRLGLELKKIESEQATVNSKMETDLLNLRNVIQVKKMMYDALQEQVRSVKQEWAEAYEEYHRTEQHKRNETAALNRQIDDLRRQIDRSKESLEKRVRELEKR